MMDRDEQLMTDLKSNRFKKLCYVFPIVISMCSLVISIITLYFNQMNEQQQQQIQLEYDKKYKAPHLSVNGNITNTPKDGSAIMFIENRGMGPATIDSISFVCNNGQKVTLENPLGCFTGLNTTNIGALKFRDPNPKIILPSQGKQDLIWIKPLTLASFDQEALEILKTIKIRYRCCDFYNQCKFSDSPDHF